MGISALPTVHFNGYDHNVLQDAAVVGVGAVGGGGMLAMQKVYSAHRGANAPFEAIVRTAVKPALLGGTIGAAAGLALVGLAPDLGDGVLVGAGGGALMGGLMSAADGFAAIGKPINGRVPSPLRVVAGPIMLGASMFAVPGAVLGGLFQSGDDEPATKD